MATLDDNSKKSGPSIADGSMAYMPKPDGTDDADNANEISLGNNKKEETKTMADIAEELEGDKSSSKVKVEVDKKADSKDQAKTNTKPKPDDIITDEPTEVEVLEPEEPIVTGGGNIPPALDEERRRGGGGGKGFLIFLVLVALVAAGIFGYLWWTKSQELTKLKSEHESTSSQTEKSDISETTATTSSDIRLIPELGLTYDFTDDVASVTYRYRETIDTTPEKKDHKVITFSSTKLVEAERKISTSAPKCTAEFSPLGALTSYAEGDTYKSGKIEDQEVDNETVLKIGDTYYIYEASQAACSADAGVQAIATEEKTAVQTLIKSLKAQE